MARKEGGTIGIDKYDPGQFRRVTPGGDITTPLPKVGSKLTIGLEPPEVLERIGWDLVREVAFVVDPEAQKDRPEPWYREANLNLGTMLLNYKVRPRHKALIVIGYMDKTKIDILLEDQADDLLAIIKRHGREDIVLKTITVQSIPKQDISTQNLPSFSR